MDERRLELKVGGLVAATVVAVLGLLWAMGELSLSRRSPLTVVFAHTGNVVQGAPVKLGGFPVGRVNRVVLDPLKRDEHGDPLPVRMELSVEPAVLATLRTDARITVSSQGPLGEPYLELYAGSPDEPLRAADAPIRGLDAPRMDLVAHRLGKFLDAATRMLDENPEAFESLIRNVSSASVTFEGLMSDNRQDLRVLVRSLTDVVTDLRQLAEFARKATAPGGKGTQLLDDALAVTQESKKVLAGLSAVAGGLNEEDGRRLKVALEKLEGIALRADRVIAQVEAGQGTLGGLYRDPKVYQDLKALVSDLKAHPWKVLWKSD